MDSNRNSAGQLSSALLTRLLGSYLALLGRLLATSDPKLFKSAKSANRQALTLLRVPDSNDDRIESEMRLLLTVLLREVPIQSWDEVSDGQDETINRETTEALNSCFKCVRQLCHFVNFNDETR